MKKIIIGLLEIYIWLAIIGGIIFIVSLSDSLGVSSGYGVVLFALCVPLIFGIVLIQIDNNQVLHNIHNLLRERKSSNINAENNKEILRNFKGYGNNDKSSS